MFVFTPIWLISVAKSIPLSEKEPTERLCREQGRRSNFILKFYLPLRSKKAGRFEKLLGFGRSHFIAARGSVSLSCATTPHSSCFSESYRYFIFEIKIHYFGKYCISASSFDHNEK